MDKAEVVTDEDWVNMHKLAEYQQQEYYELLPQWTKYHVSEYAYLKQNIGFAIFGSPKQPKASDESAKQMVLCNENINNDNCDVTDVIHYEPDAILVIDKIFKKICEFGEGCIDAEFIYYGIIFNVTLPTKKEGLKKQEMYSKPTPVFKIMRVQSNALQDCASTTWYIDINGRLYKSWSDYKEHNTLPECTMILPKDGFYQPDCSYEVTENFSRVWLEEAESPACAITSTILYTGDVVSTIAGVAGITLGFATLFTPLAPVAIGAAVASGGTAGWSIGRSIHNLVDRSIHEESINPLEDRHAFSSWLSITGSAFGLAASGGTALITKAVSSGNTVNVAARTAYNTIVIGSLSIHGVGIVYQAYCMYEEYQEEGKLSIASVASFGTHILFFGNSVINLQLAGNLIKSTQGEILNEYKNTIRSKRLLKQFNRVKRVAAANNADSIHENAEVVQFINKKYQVWEQNKIQIQTRVQTQNNVKDFKSISITFQNGVIKINNITLIDPMKFVLILIKEDKNRRKNENNDTFGTCVVRSLLLTLVDKFNPSNSCQRMFDFNIRNCQDIIDELIHFKNVEDILNPLLKLSVILIETSDSPSKCLATAIHFLWYYVRKNLEEQSLTLTTLIDEPETQDTLRKLINCMFTHADKIVQSVIPAFATYLLRSKE